MPAAALSQAAQRFAPFVAASQPAGAPALDLVHLARQSLGDQQLERELLALFDHHSARVLAQIAQLSGSEWRSRALLAHKLKGSALAIGAASVASAAAAVERLSDAQAPAAAQALEALVAAVDEARQAIARLS